MIDRVRERIYPPDARQFEKYRKKEGTEAKITKRRLESQKKVVRRKSGEVFIVVLGI